MSKNQQKDKPRRMDTSAANGTESPTQRPRHWRLWGLVGAKVIIVAGLGAYSNSFQGVFVFDDEHAILHNPSVREFEPTWERTARLFSSDLRPAVTMSLALNYRWGQQGDGEVPSTWGFHLVNVVVHLVAALALFGIVRRTLLTDRLREQFGRAASPVALAAAVIWMLHPLQTGSVTYIIQRAESAMGMFFLLTLYCAIRSYAATSWRQWLWYAGSIAACVLGMWSKQVMAVAPVMVVLYDVIFISRGPIKAYRRHWPLYIGLFATWYWAIVPLLELMTGEGGMTTVHTDIAMRQRTPLQYTTTQPQVILHYIRLCLWPRPQCLDYYWQPTSMSLTGLYMPGAVILLLLLAWGLALWKRPALGFLGAWFFLILSPSSTVVPLADIAFEHRLYLSLAAVVVGIAAGGYLFGHHFLPKLASMEGRKRLLAALAPAAGVGLAAGALRAAAKVFWPAEPGDALAAELGTSGILAVAVMIATWTLLLLLAGLARWRRKLTWRLAGAVLAVAAAMTLGCLTFLRNRTYHIESDVWRHVLRARPGNPRAHNNLGKALYFENQALRKQGRPAETEQIEQSEHHFAQAIRLENNYADPYYNMALILSERANDPSLKNNDRFKGDPDAYEEFRNGKIEEAKRYYHRALQLKPGFPQAHNNLAILLDRQGEWLRTKTRGLPPSEAAQLAAKAEQLTQEAVKHFRLAIHANRRYAFAYSNLAALFNRQASRDLELAYRLDRQGQAALAARHRQRAMNSTRLAEKQLSKAAKYNPHFPDLYVNLGLVWMRQSLAESDPQARQELMDNAIAAWRKGLQLKPGMHEAREGLGQALADRGDLAGAAAEFVTVIRAQPGNVRARGRLARVLYRARRYQQATAHYRNVLMLKSDYLPALKDLAWLLATVPVDQVRNGAEALRLAQQACKATANNDASCLDVLAVAHAELKQFDQAVAAATRAVELATQANDAQLAQAIQERLKLYASGRPVRVGTPPKP